MHWLIVVAIVAFIWWYHKRAKRLDPLAPHNRVAPTPCQQPDDSDLFEVVGESFYQHNFLRLFGPKGEHGRDDWVLARLTPEPDNKHDKNAVKVEISGLIVGHMPRDDAKDITGYMRRRKMPYWDVPANVRGGWRNASGEGSFGVTVAFPPDTI